ncbi:MAG: hypothetical protein R3F39_15675 [Myxococcota bacterium]
MAEKDQKVSVLGWIISILVFFAVFAVVKFVFHAVLHVAAWLAMAVIAVIVTSLILGRIKR